MRNLARLGPAATRELKEAESRGQRRLAERAAYRLAALVQSSDDAIIAKTLDGVITDWNPGAVRLYGYAREEVVGRHISLIVPPDRCGELAGIMERLGRGERIGTLETVRLRKDGSPVHVSLTISPIRDAAGRVIGVSKTARDVSERKEAERRLAEAGRAKEETLALLETLLKLAPVGFAFLDQQLRYARCNATLAEMNGLPPADHIGRTISEVVPALWPLLEPTYRSMLATGQPQPRLEISGETAAAPGKVRHFLTSLYPVRVEGEVAGIGVVWSI